MLERRATSFESLGELLAQFSPFYFDRTERIESGITECRTLRATALAFHGWRDRNPTR